MSHSFSNLFHMSRSMSTSTIWFLKAGKQRKFHTQDSDFSSAKARLCNKSEKDGNKSQIAVSRTVSKLSIFHVTSERNLGSFTQFTQSCLRE